MLKVVAVVLVLVAFCHCSSNDLLVEDARASKKKKSALKLWALILFFAFSKIAIFKVASFMFFYMIFQKLFYFAGIFLAYLMKQKTDQGHTPTMPSTVYGPPGPANLDYNTIGYSYGPPEQSKEHPFDSTEYGYPGLPDVAGSFNNWFFNKNP